MHDSAPGGVEVLNSSVISKSDRTMESFECVAICEIAIVESSNMEYGDTYFEEVRSLGTHSRVDVRL